MVTDEPIVLRPSQLERVFERVFAAALLVYVAVVIAFGYWSTILMGVPGIFLLRFSRREVRGDSHGLVVRNTLRTRRIAMSQVRRFEIHRISPWNKQIRVLLLDGRRIPLKVTYRVDVGKEPGPELEELLTRFDTWMRAREL